MQLKYIHILSHPMYFLCLAQTKPIHSLRKFSMKLKWTLTIEAFSILRVLFILALAEYKTHSHAHSSSRSNSIFFVKKYVNVTDTCITSWHQYVSSSQNCGTELCSEIFSHVVIWIWVQKLLIRNFHLLIPSMKHFAFPRAAQMRIYRRTRNVMHCNRSKAC